MSGAAAAVELPRLMRQPIFLRFWLMRICSTLGFQIVAVAVGWQVFALTESTLALGPPGSPPRPTPRVRRSAVGR